MYRSGTIDLEELVTGKLVGMYLMKQDVCTLGFIYQGGHRPLPIDRSTDILTGSAGEEQRWPGEVLRIAPSPSRAARNPGFILCSVGSQVGVTWKCPKSALNCHVMVEG